MANLPTAYASQRYGRKSLDFYAASGEAIGADPRARSDERRLQDFDGARHTVRLSESKFALEPGDQATVLRLQPGPERRSRPVAVVNHARGTWTRTHPGASAVLSRSGIARNVNWTLTMGLFALAALASVWPFLHTFLAELIPAAAAPLPRFDVFALAAASVPPIASFDMAVAAAPVTALLEQIRPGLGAWGPAAAFGGIALLAAIVVFGARSWRLLWAPLFVGGIGAAALGFGGPAEAVTPFVSGLGIAAAVFLAGGVWNRLSDEARLERRIALLADHLLSEAPEETVRAARDEAADDEAAVSEDGDPASDDDSDVLVGAGAAGAVAASLSRLEGEAEPGDIEAETLEAPAEAAIDAETATDGEAPERRYPALPEAETAEETVAAEAEVEVATETEAEPDALVDQAEPDPVEAEAPSTDDVAASEDVVASEDERPLEPALSAGEADGPNAHADGGLDPEEAERLKTDPRYAARAIVLPPPPPMPVARRTPDPAPGEPELETAGGPETRTLNPGRPLPDNVVPIFAAPAPREDS
ncbi:MAG: hypothetical protein ABL308_06050 [Oceanicaulis sp.]